MTYKLEDIEYLKQRTDLTYDEAAALLDRYDGDVVKVLVHLEKQGRVHEARAAGQQEQAQKKPQENTHRFKDFLKKMLSHRLVIKRDDTVIVNLSLLFVLIAVLTAPWLALFAFIVTMVLGYKYSRRVDRSFTGEEFNDIGSKASSAFKDFSHKVWEEKEENNYAAADNNQAADTESAEQKNSSAAYASASRQAGFKYTAQPTAGTKVNTKNVSARDVHTMPDGTVEIIVE